MISVLYIDDEPDLLELGKVFLEQAGDFSVTPFCSATEALDLMAGENVDLVISDFQMPEMDGIALLKEVRSRYSNLPFILFTGRGREEVVIEAINNGVDFYLQKGGDTRAQFTELAHKITAAVERRRALDQYRSVIENIQDIFYRCDRDGNLVMASPSLLRTLGYDSLDELIGRPITRTLYYRPDNREELLRVIAEKGYIEDYEVQLKRKDGSPVWVSTYSHYHRDTGGSIAGVEGVFRDISRRKEIEDGLYAANRKITAQGEALRVQLEELERANQALVRNEEDFESLVESAPDAIYISVGERFVYVNPAFVSLLGAASPDQILGASLYDRIPPEYHAAIHERANLIIEDGKPAGLSDTVYLKMDGSPVDVESSAAPFRFHGKAAGLVILRNITERKRAEAALRESELRYRHLLEQSFDAAIIHQAGRVVFANDPAARLLKAPGPGSLAGRNIMELVGPASGRVIGEWIRILAESPFMVVPPAEERFCCPDGTPVDVEVIASPTIYRERPAILVMFRDISRRKAAEITLTESEKRYRQILQYASDSIMIHEITEARPGRIVEVNDKTCQMLGYTREELLGMSIPDIDAPEQVEVSPEIQRRLFAEGTSLFPAEHMTKDGRRIPVEVSNSLMILDGRLVVLAVIRDMRVQKRAEQVLRETNRKLGLLSSVTRHDLRNKVTALSGYIALAKKSATDPALAGYLEKLDSITATISEHIEFTRIYENLGSVEPVWHDPEEIISRQRVPQNLALEIDLPPVTISADPIFPTVFSNLIDNTVRHGKHATAIRVSAREGPDGLVIVWEDDGTGIKANEKEKIFTRGFGKNTGLGLFLTREILAITGISVTETGVPGKGARFELLVPKGSYRFRGE
jgi:PAS domain S-box-containing protein